MRSRSLYPHAAGVRALVLGTALLLLLACGDDSSRRTDDQAQGDAADPAPSIAVDAPAATGSGLDTPPGPPEREAFPDFDEVAIAVTDLGGETRGACVLLAVTPEQRQQGLMEVTDLGGYAGMLFVAPTETVQSFWMRNTPMALSIAWFDDEGDYVSEADMDPYDETSHSSGSPARFALEMPQGELPDLGVAAGSTLRIGGSCA